MLLEDDAALGAHVRVTRGRTAHEMVQARVEERLGCTHGLLMELHGARIIREVENLVAEAPGSSAEATHGVNDLRVASLSYDGVHIAPRDGMTPTRRRVAQLIHMFSTTRHRRAPLARASR